MGEIPYIGAKISLISRGDIRYEGTLYTIDMNESTIALQNGAGTGPSPAAVPGVPGLLAGSLLLLTVCGNHYKFGWLQTRNSRCAACSKIVWH